MTPLIAIRDSHPLAEFHNRLGNLDYVLFRHSPYFSLLFQGIPAKRFYKHRKTHIYEFLHSNWQEMYACLIAVRRKITLGLWINQNDL